MKLTEENFISELKRGNEKALVYVVDQYGSLLCGIIRRKLCLLKEYQEECLNDVFFSIWQNISHYDADKNSFANWASGIARYKAIDYLRRYYKKIPTASLEELELSEPDQNLEDLIECEISEELEEMLSCLKEQDRELFLQIYIQEKEVGQVSQETGISREVIYNRLSRGKKKIRKRYAPGRENEYEDDL